LSAGPSCHALVAQGVNPRAGLRSTIVAAGQCHRWTTCRPGRRARRAHRLVVHGLDVLD